MSLVAYILAWIIQLYIWILIARAVLDFGRIMAQDWRPRGVVLVIANLIYALTDPPLRFLGRYIPPLQLGPIALDVGFAVLLVVLSLALTIVARF